MTDIFSPPPSPIDGEGYTFGNIVWEYEEDNGVWNIKSASLVGAAGAQGVQGTQGVQGLQGIQGLQGRQGLQGVQGSQGIQGLQGTQGLQGIQGLQGLQGVQGSQGIQGLQGTQGLQGLQGLQGRQGLQGIQGLQGLQGIQGLQGAAGVGLNAGTQHQVLFKDGSNAVAGDNDFLFDGTSATFGGGTFAFDADTYVANGIYKFPAEWSVYGTTSGASLSINPANGTIQRYNFTPDPNFTVSFNSAGWSAVTGAVETIAVILRSENGNTGSFNANIYTETGSRKPVICGVTGGIDILTLMRIKTASGFMRMGFQVANGMTGTNLDGID